MTMSITTLNNQSTEPSDHSNQNQSNSTSLNPQEPLKNSTSHPRRTRKSKLLANRRRRSRNQPDYDEDLEADQNDDEQSRPNHLTTGSDSTSSDCDDSTTSSLSNSNSDLSVDEFEQDQTQFVDLEAGHQTCLQSESSSTFVPNKIAKIKPGQTPTDDPSQSPTAHSTATQPSLTSSSATRRHKQQPSPTSTTTTTTTTTSTNQTNHEDLTATNNNTPSINNNNNTTIIFNQGSWITGLNTNTNEDQPTVQTPRYIPFIEFDNFNAYGSLIFDLNTGLSSRSRVEYLSNHELMQEIEQEQAAARRALKKREKRLSKLRGDKRPNSRPSTGTPLTVNIISPSQPNHRHSAHRTGSPLPSSTRPPSSLAGHTANRPPSAFSNAISETNQSAAASEEPWTIPRSGRFWGHDDRQSHSQRGGRGMRGGNSRGSHARGRGGGGGIIRGAGHHGKGGFRADWEEQRRHQPNLHPNGPPNNHHLHLQRPDTPAGQSDTGRSVGSGAGWITVQAKQKSFGSNGHQLSNGDGEWRHDGWEEIERESDRKSAHQRARGYQFYRGGAPNRRGMAVPANQPPLRSSSLRRPTNSAQPNQNHSEVSSTTPSTFQEPLVNGVSKVSKSEPNGSSTTDVPEPTTKSPGPVSTVSVGPGSLDAPTEASQVESTKIDEVKVCLNSKHSLPIGTPTPEYQEDKAESVIQTLEAPDKTGTCSNTSDSASITVASSPDKKSKDETQVKRSPADEDEAPRSGIVVKLPTTIKIGTIPVYHHSTIIPEVSGAIKINGSTSTPLVQQPQSQLNEEHNGITSRERPTFDLPPLPHPPPSSSITLGSIGGAEILREAMSASIHHLPPPVPVPTPFVNHYHHDYYPLEPPPPQQQTGMLLQGEEEDRSRHISFTPSAGSSSGNSSQTPFPHDHHSHLHQHPPNMFNSHPPPPPPPIDPQHHFNPLHHFYHPHPHPPPPLPPLQYFDPITGQHMIYPHPQQPQPLPPPPPPMFFDLPPTQAPLPPPPSQPLPPSSESLLTLSTPGLYAPPPRSSKVRIKDPISGLEKEKFGGEIKCFEHKGVTYFHQEHPSAVVTSPGAAAAHQQSQR
ncbi:uncharacterized protein MELLADRAFT_78709 [Melampsora larici-populina 98AG31]|uniref:Btz domain-containing protein n=1 Tax=Melampsora larici-populina (strain 98AG31 / pathotype 3-4-7) TaxID=747676 RepID=F4RXN8_MELLP|nr:uncharacterized protein MELLADRAFT_78709 [Melampsora larici-populina 98AG31]EGG02760.1 hypothetical protein MELLADRAFT_78709 [Melampsora larici-populina 98AG31]